MASPMVARTESEIQGRIGTDPTEIVARIVFVLFRNYRKNRGRRKGGSRCS